MRAVMAVACVVFLLQSLVVQANDPIMRDLLDPGVMVVEGKRVPLEPPIKKSITDSAQVRSHLTNIAGDRPLDEFLRESAVAPFNLKMASISDAGGKRIAQKVDVWFVAYGKLSTLQDKGLLEDLAATAKAEAKQAQLAEGGQFDEATLAKAGIRLFTNENQREGFGSFSSPLLDRVLVSGVVHTWQTIESEQITVSSVLDDRFSATANLSNRWQAIIENGGDKPQLGPAQPYVGFGGYLAATALKEPAGALLIEAHVVFHEPEGWFRGANLLRSKLPIAIQEQIRSFRRKLAAAEKSGTSQ